MNGVYPDLATSHPLIPELGIKAGRVEKPTTPSKKSAAANTSFTIVKTEEMPTPPAEVSFSPMMSFESAYGSGRLSMVGSDSYPSYDDEI